MLKQVSVFLENKKGRLKDVLKLLAESNIDIRAMTIAETSNYGVLRLVVDKTDLAVKVLKENNFKINLTDVLGVEIQDISGSMYEFVNMLYEHNINVEYAHTCTQLNPGKSAFILRVDEDKLSEALDIIKTRHDVKIIE